MYGVTFCGETSGSVGKRIGSTIKQDDYLTDSQDKNYVSFHGGETTGSIGKRGETTGSIGKRNETVFNEPVIINSSPLDVVCFKSKDEGLSLGTKTALTGLSAALLIAGLGYTHKMNLVSKLKDGKLKNILQKTDTITEPCHMLCSKTKNIFKSLFKK